MLLPLPPKPAAVSLSLPPLWNIAATVAAVFAIAAAGFAIAAAVFAIAAARAAAAGRIRLSLYGHKLPVTSLSVSSSGLLLASGSVDKSLKLWGLDFGDIRKSFRAHEEAVTKVGRERGL